MNRRASLRESGIAPRLLAWYDRERRDLPWRYAPGTTADPYRVWLSEIMLQQTVVKAVIPYFEAFTRRWPTVADLAAAPLDDVLAAWAGLGYYSRARNLHACARAITDHHAGHFPSDETALLSLPGIGPYTAAAITAIGFGHKATPVDGNVERVVARLFAIADPLPGAKATLKAKAETLTPNRRAGDFAQSMMDLGATVCTPRNPTCGNCPIRLFCRAFALDIATELPARTAKADRPMRTGTAFVVHTRDGSVLLRQRPMKGLLGGMLEVPSTPWLPSTEMAPPMTFAPVKADWVTANETVVHVFTHFRLELAVLVAKVAKHVALLDAAEADHCKWVDRTDLADAALPTVMRKVLVVALRRSEP